MKKPPVILALSGALAVCGALLLPQQSSGQGAVAEPDPQSAKLLAEIGAQQTTIAENQAKMDESLAAVGENVRLARIFAGRGGGKTK